MDVELKYRRSSLRKLCGRASRRVSDQTQKAMGACSALRHCGTEGEVIHKVGGGTVKYLGAYFTVL